MSPGRNTEESVTHTQMIESSAVHLSTRYSVICSPILYVRSLPSKVESSTIVSMATEMCGSEREMKILSGFMSKCTRLIEWMYCKPCQSQQSKSSHKLPWQLTRQTWLRSLLRSSSENTHPSCLLASILADRLPPVSEIGEEQLLRFSTYRCRTHSVWAYGCPLPRLSSSGPGVDETQVPHGHTLHAVPQLWEQHRGESDLSNIAVGWYNRKLLLTLLAFR